MTAYRRSFVFCKEHEFGKGNQAKATKKATGTEYEYTADGRMATSNKEDTVTDWIQTPPGTYISFNMARSVSLVRSCGNKTWDEAAYGQFAGTFDISMPLDYNYPELLIAAFEGYAHNNDTETPTNGSVCQNQVGEGGERGSDSQHTHAFFKKNSSRVGSCCFRCKQLNEVAGGPENSDECIELYGCVINSVSLSMSASSSKISVSLGGVFADARILVDGLDATDYRCYTDEAIAQWACLVVDGEYMEVVDDMSVAAGNGAAMVYTTCSPFAREYYEGGSTYTFSARCYSNDPRRLQLRHLYGGYVGDLDPAFGTRKKFCPAAKGLSPARRIDIYSYDKSLVESELNGTLKDDMDIDGTESMVEKVKKAYVASDKGLHITLLDCVMKSMTFAKGNDSKLQDILTSSDCRYARFVVKNGYGGYYVDDTVNDTDSDDTDHKADTRNYCTMGSVHIVRSSLPRARANRNILSGR